MNAAASKRDAPRRIRKGKTALAPPCPGGALAAGTLTHYTNALVPRSPVRIRMASARGQIKIRPSPWFSLLLI